jgi:hypothetical protein
MFFYFITHIQSTFQGLRTPSQSLQLLKIGAYTSVGAPKASVRY